MRRLRIVIPVTLVLLGLLSAALVANRSFWTQTPLERLALQLAEMPAGTTQLSADYPTQIDDVGHVLCAKSDLKTGPYVECYTTTALANVDATDVDGKALGKKASFPVIQMLYRYATDAEARAQFQRLSQPLGETPGAVILPSQTQEGRDGRQWVTARMIGSEGDTIYWYIGVKGRVLTLLCADDLQALDGRPRSSGQALFEALVGRATAR